MDKFGWFKTLILITGIGLIALGVYLLPLDFTSQRAKISSGLVVDSTISTSNTVDSGVKKTTKTDLNKVYKTSPATVPPAENLQPRYDNAYKYISLGIFVLFLLYLLPYITTFNLMGIFGATFRERMEAFKIVSNQVEQATALSVAAQTTTSTTTRPPMQDGVAMESALAEQIVIYTDDPQKGRWGKESSRNGRQLTAIVKRKEGSYSLFTLALKVSSIDPLRPLQGSVVFHLHNTFPNPNPVIYVTNGEATLSLVAWGAFTVGAEADGGATALELDLSKLTDAPEVFKAR